MFGGTDVPAVLGDAVLYRVTYQGRTEEWGYECDLRTTTHGWEVLLHVGAATRSAYEHLRRHGLAGLLDDTTCAIQATLPGCCCAWESLHHHNRWWFKRRCMIPLLGREEFGEAAACIIRRLPRLDQALITAYYE